MAIWKVELLVNLEEGCHPRKWIPDAVGEGLNKDKGEDVLNWEYELLSEEEKLNLG